MDGQTPGNSDTQPATPWQFKPGDTIAPGSSPAQSEPSQPSSPATSDPPVSQEQAPTETPEPAITPQPRMQSTDSSISWTASEFIAHHKTLGWYAVLAMAAAILAAIVFLLTRDKISTTAVVVIAAIFGMYGARKPRQLRYSLSPDGLTIGEKFYNLAAFRSFSVVREGAFSSVFFVPHKRFSLGLSIYYDPADEQKIVGLLSDIMPMEPPRNDVIDNFMRKIRF